MRQSIRIGLLTGTGSRWCPLFVHVMQLRLAGVPVRYMRQLTAQNEAKARTLK